MRATVVVIFVALLATTACNNKKFENHLKSLEKRVAALERSQEGTVATSQPLQTGEGTTGMLPEITFQHMEYDFGTVNEGDVVDHIFAFSNTGKSPLIIQKATATCGCTVPSWPREPIPVGGKGEIKVKFDSKNRQNLQTKYVTITANTQPQQVRLKISGRILPKNNQ